MNELIPATFPSANSHGYISCSSEPSPVEGIIARVSLNMNFVLGDELRLYSQGYRRIDGNDPIPETDTRFKRILAPGDEGKSIEFIIGPYTTKIKPIGSGSLGVYYTLVRGGKVIESPKSLVKISLELPGGGTCPE